MYVNKYERKDMIAYWKVFLKWMNELENRIPIFSGNNLKKIIWSDNNMQLLILITHDECIFSTYDGSQSLWISNRK